MLFLIASPMFYTQSEMMALLDMPAMTFTALALLLFLDDRVVACAAACTALVLMKETASPRPLVFAAWLMFREKRIREALYFFAPGDRAGRWLVVLASRDRTLARQRGVRAIQRERIAAARPHSGIALAPRSIFCSSPTAC